MIYVVLGMHKSGTSLVSEMLHKSGINMGNFDESLGYDSENHYERWESFILNLAMLNSRVCEHSLNLTNVINPSDLAGNIMRNLSNFIIKMNEIHKNWGFKDPRTCLTYGIWKENLSPHKIIFIYRHPAEVWLHYMQKIHPIRFIKKIFMGWKALKSWFIYNSQALKYVNLLDKDAIIINYSEIMGNSLEFRRLENFLGIKLHDSRKKTLYRSKKKTIHFFKLIVLIQKIIYSRNIFQLLDKLKEK